MPEYLSATVAYIQNELRKVIVGQDEPIEQILVAASPLDLAEIESWLRRMVGGSDPRLGKFEEIRDRLSLVD